MRRVYLDWNASAPLRPEARAAMVAALDVTGNPSSVHAEGRAARKIVEAARAQVAEGVGCKPAEVVFTSGATEAASVLARLPGGVAVNATAHDALWSHSREGAGTLAWGLACGETGIVTPPPDPVDGHWPTEQGPAERLLIDATQAVGRIPWSFAWSGADMAVVSAHKLGGPRGVGALIVRDGVDIPPLATGGGQEMGRRSGTQNVAGIAGFGAAVAAAMRDLDAGAWDAVSQLRNILETALEAAAPGVIFVARDEARLPNTSCVIAPGWKGETQVMAMDLAGFAVSSGAACSSGKVRESRVLRALGYGPDAARQAMRVSLGPGLAEEDIVRFADAWGAQYRKIVARAA